MLAASLYISPWTVKKRWHAIYEGVADVDGELLPPPVADGPYATSRVRNAEGTCLIICDSTPRSFVRIRRRRDAGPDVRQCECLL